MTYSKRKEVINQVSRADWFSQDNYYGLEHSFQYSENINCDDELHGIKLSTKADYTNYLAGCQLIEAWNKVFSFPLATGWKIHYFDKNNWNWVPWTSWGPVEVSGVTIPAPGSIPWWDITTSTGTTFQNRLWFWVYVWNPNESVNGFITIPLNNGVGTATTYIPYDHSDFTDESILTPSSVNPMVNAITCILNFNNSRLIVASWNELRCYYPELDRSNPANTSIYSASVQPWQTWWKKVQTYWWWQYIIGLTCSFEYLKVWVQDWDFSSTKVFFYQGNDDFRSTFVYNQIDLKNVKVMRIYSINWIDYYTESLDGTDWFVSFNKLIGSTPVQIFTRKGWLVPEDIFGKAWYFIGPTSLDASYINGDLYLADAHWVFKFKYNPSWKDTWYLKWKLNNTKQNVVWLAICQNYLYVSYKNSTWYNGWIYRMRLYDTGEDWYQSTGFLISRELEGKSFQWCFTKILDEIRLNYELNHLIWNNANWSIEVFVSPNNRWTDTNPSWTGSDGRYKIMEIDWDMKNTRTQISHLLNNYTNQNWETGMEFDRQTITYLIKINKWNNNQATPIVREIQLWYHTKGKTNEIYDLQ